MRVGRAARGGREAGVERSCRFEVADAKSYPGNDYDLVAFFDCLHDMGDPAGAAKHVRQSLGVDGTWLIVEPYADDTVEGNLNPVGRIYYAASTMICVPASLSQEVGLALGRPEAGEARLREVVMAGGFTRFRRATATPFNLVLEAASLRGEGRPTTGLDWMAEQSCPRSPRPREGEPGVGQGRALAPEKRALRARQRSMRRDFPGP